MEAKLKEYRAVRRRKELIDNAKEKFEKSKEKLVNLLIPKIIQDMGRIRDDEEVLLMENEQPPPMEQPPPKQQPLKQIEEINDVMSETSETESFEENEESWNRCLIKWTIYAIIWAGFWAIFLKLQFGAVYFVISMLFVIYFNTRTRPKKKGEVSAYSVFNENCKSIDGALTPEQFEREMLYGARNIRIF